MRVSTLAILFATAAMLGSSAAYGQYRFSGNARRPVAQRSTYEYKSYYQPADETSPSDAPLSPVAPAPLSSGDAASAYAPSCDAAPSCAAEPSCEAEPTCEASCGCHSKSHCCCDWCHLGEPWELFDGCFCEDSGVVIKGWIDQGITFNDHSPNDRFNGPMSFNDRDREWQMNQFYLYLEKAPNTEECCTDWGYRVDLLYGTDWRFTPAVGLEIDDDGTRDWNRSNRFYGLALPQFYASYKINDLEIKAGKWYTPAGYEVVTSPGNFFYSHLYTHQYGEPFTHTGVLGTWKMTDNWTVLAGIHEGWDQFEDTNDSPSLIAGATWTSCDQKTSLAYVMTYGDEANHLFFQNTQNRYYHGVVFQRQVNDKLKYVAHHDYGHQEDVGGAGTPDAEWYSISQYLIYKVNDCLSYGFRYEAFRDDDGFRVTGVGNAEFGQGIPSPMGFIGGGYAGTFQDVSFGINYKPHANLMIRPEVRYDWYDGLNGAGSAGAAARPLPFDSGTSDDQLMFATDVIFTF